MVAQPLSKSSPIILHPANQTQRKETPRKRKKNSMSRLFGGKKIKKPSIDECIQFKVRSLEKTFSNCVL